MEARQLNNLSLDELIEVIKKIDSKQFKKFMNEISYEDEQKKIIVKNDVLYGAAFLCKNRGYQVEVYEKTSKEDFEGRLIEQIDAKNRLEPDKATKLRELYNYLEKEILKTKWNFDNKKIQTIHEKTTEVIKKITNPTYYKLTEQTNNTIKGIIRFSDYSFQIYKRDEKNTFNLNVNKNNEEYLNQILIYQSDKLELKFSPATFHEWDILLPIQSKYFSKLEKFFES